MGYVLRETYENGEAAVSDLRPSRGVESECGSNGHGVDVNGIGARRPTRGRVATGFLIEH